METRTDQTKTRWGDWLTAGLLFIIMQIAAGRLIATLWTEDLRLVQLTAFLGTVLGLALGKSIFRRFWVVYLAILYGVVVIPWQLGLTLGEDITWHDRLINLGGRLMVVLNEIFTRQPVTDNLLFVLLMAILFWAVSVYSGYEMIRHGNPWKVIIPGGIVVFAIHSFDPLLVSRSWYLAFYLFFSLIIVARLVYLKNTAKWRMERTHTPPDMGFDFSRVALLLSMILVFFAWNVPVLADTFRPAASIWQTASRPWLTAKDRMGFMFASLRASVGLVQNFYGDTLALGLGNPLSDQVIMEVEGPTNLPNGYRFYWEARSYATYEDNRWQNSPRDEQDLTADSLYLNQPGEDVRPVVTTTFFPHVPISNLFAAPAPLWTNLPTQAQLDLNPDGTVNFEALMSENFIRPGERYTVRSSIDALTIAQLKESGSEYPDWVLEEYLQLPRNITPRTQELAAEIAGDLTNPYDIATAVTEYLRDNIQYNLTIEQPPPNQERIDWFLFDYKEGFCNYYASAEVILLRSLGIPARMGVGFAQGERQIPPIEDLPPEDLGEGQPGDLISETSTYIVRKKDAHAWPEVFFPGIGWVIFEPTVSQPDLLRPEGNALDIETENPEITPPEPVDPLNRENPDNPNPADKAEEGGGSGSNFWTIANIARLILLAFTVGLVVVVIRQVRAGFRLAPLVERMSVEVPEEMLKIFTRLGIQPPEFLLNWLYLKKLPAIARSYLEINRALKRLGKMPAVQDTPHERTASLIAAVPNAAVPAERLLSEYQTSMYSPYQANTEAAREAGAEIRNLSWRARLNRILARFQEPEAEK